MSIVDVISHALNEHAVRAAREGRGLEASFVALIKEIVMTSVNELQGKVGGLSDKMAQLEADVKDLVSKQGGTAGGGPASGLVVTQDQLDSMGVAVDSVGARIDALKAEVVNGPAQVPAEPPVTTPPVTAPAPASPPTTIGAAPAPTSPPPGT